jgi:hypothetical protein
MPAVPNELAVARRLLAAVAALALLACGDGPSGDGGTAPVTPAPTPTPGPTPPPEQPRPATLAVHAGDDQQAPADSAVPQRPEVIVRDAAGAPMAGVSVAFSVAAGGGQVAGSPATTDAGGIARPARWTLGPRGAQRLEARVEGLPPVTVRASVDPGSVVDVFEVPSNGGRFTLEEEGHPYDGLTLDVPAGAFPSPVQWRLRAAPELPAPPLPSGVTPAGPVLELRSAAGRANALLTLELPLPGRDGRAVVVVLRDPVRGTMEVLPAVGRSAHSITVMTGHLQAQLLTAPETGAASRRDAASTTFPDEVTHLLPLELVVPIEPVAAPIERWPVVDHGSAAFPDGHGIATPALELVASRRGLGASLATIVRTLDRPGFYAEAGPLAALHLAHQQLAGPVQDLMRQLQQSLARVGKAERDEMVHLTVLATIRLSSRPSMVGVFMADDASPIVGTAYRGTETELTLATPGSEAPVTVARNAGGYLFGSIRRVADRLPVEARELVVLQASALPLERIGPVFERLRVLGQLPLDSDLRAQRNAELAADAGLPVPVLDVRVDAESPWQPLVGRDLVARSPELALRLREYAAALHAPSGQAITEAPDGEIAIANDAELLGSAGREAVLRSVVLMSTAAGSTARQISATMLRVQYAKFAITPSEVALDQDEVEVQFAASVEHPPSSGYRIEWDWGDQTVAQVENRDSASHTYTFPDDYTVTATLFAANGDRLASSTARVVAGPARAWQITDFVDLDGLLDEFGPGELPSELAALPLLRELPRRGAIIVSPRAGGGTELRLRARRGTIWPRDTRHPGHTLGDEVMLVLGRALAVPHLVGPFFAGWERDFWSETTTDLLSGSMSAKQAQGHTVYRVENRGNQRGPTGGVQFEGVRAGNRLTGTISIVVWFMDEDTGEVYDEPPEVFRFGYEATLFRVP